MKKNVARWFVMIGIQNTKSLNQQIIPAIGGALSIFIVYFISYKFTDLTGASAILPSMGAATVLLFSAPKGQFPRPWPLFAGNLLSAIIGVCCYQWLGDIFIAASCAVGLSIFAMLLCRCIHPPGGATALAAVVGGDVVHQLGFYYVIIPTFINCLVIFSVAVVFHYLLDQYRARAR
ncbi:MAG: HPP family protein [Gammaproteobacteria bacterium]|nr:HPP family protein [Gammaproteobacteria bacterium]